MLRRHVFRNCALFFAFLFLLAFLYQWLSRSFSDVDHETVMDSSRRTWKSAKTHVFQALNVFSPGDPRRYDSSSSETSHFHPLPGEVVNSVGRFVFFLGYARSGHSIIASMLDAHPHVMIAHEYSLFLNWNLAAACHHDKSCLFNAIYNNSWFSVNSGWRTKQAMKKGYSLGIPGWWQGKYKDYISVIGDKSGGMTAQTFRNNHSNFFALYRQLKETVQLPVSVFHVVRNPYDNIATMLLYNMHVKRKVNISQKYVNYDGLKEQIIAYFNQVRSVLDIINRLRLDVIEVHNADFINNPQMVMGEVCRRLKMTCADDYLKMCAARAYTSVSQSRHLVEWRPDLVKLAADKMEGFEHLRRYTAFDS